MDTTPHSEFSNDQPISSKAEDRLNRAPFAERIASILVDVPAGEGLVVGIHGPWGDGKTSVLNFIRTDLSKTENVVCVTYNPWRFTDESAMLVGFFQILATTIRKELKTKGEKIAGLIGKFANLASILDSRAETVANFANSKAKASLEDLRNRIIEALSAVNKRIIVLIDDIDRLDRNESYTLFRLIKACADFPNVCYVLAFDDVTVAKAIGKRYGGGKKSGQAFLEKIIQVPLKLPVAVREDLRSLCLEQVDRALSVAGIELSREAVGAFVSCFDRGVSIRVDTPRASKRYGNSLLFALPMLKDEVNIVDLLLLEAVRAFYPEIYDCIRSNHTDYSGIGGEYFGKPEDILESYKSLNKLIKKLDMASQKAVKSLIIDLFPRINGLFGNIRYGSDWLNGWAQAKRACSPNYCQRYFTYSIPLFDISDSEITMLLTAATNGDDKKVCNSLKEHLKGERARRLIEKLRYVEHTVDPKGVPTLCIAIAKHAEQIPNYQTLFSPAEPPTQAAILISRLFERIVEHEERVSLAKRIINSANPLWFGEECLRWWYVTDEPDKADHNALTKDEIANVRSVLIDRIKQRSVEGHPLFDVDVRQEQELLFEWWRGEGRAPVQEHLLKIFKHDPNLIPKFLQAMSPRAWGDRDVIPRVGDLDEGPINNIELIIDLDLLADLIRNHCLGNFNDPQWRSDNSRSLEQRLAEQFMFVCNKKKNQHESIDSQEESTDVDL